MDFNETLENFAIIPSNFNTEEVETNNLSLHNNND